MIRKTVFAITEVREGRDPARYLITFTDHSAAWTATENPLMLNIHFRGEADVDYNAFGEVCRMSIVQPVDATGKHARLGA